MDRVGGTVFNVTEKATNQRLGTFDYGKIHKLTYEGCDFVIYYCDFNIYHFRFRK
jgi:hypothetical protein